MRDFIPLGIVVSFNDVPCTVTGIAAYGGECDVFVPFVASEAIEIVEGDGTDSASGRPEVYSATHTYPRDMTVGRYNIEEIRKFIYIKTATSRFATGQLAW
jgi:hypothetical protein